MLQPSLTVNSELHNYLLQPPLMPRQLIAPSQLRVPAFTWLQPIPLFFQVEAKVLSSLTCCYFLTSSPPTLPIACPTVITSPPPCSLPEALSLVYKALSSDTYNMAHALTRCKSLHRGHLLSDANQSILLNIAAPHPHPVLSPPFLFCSSVSSMEFINF